jgi:apolipoprotein N-acyltransferase
MTVAIWLLDGSAQSKAVHEQGRSRRFLAGLLDAGIAGWWLGFGYFVAGLWWLGAAFLVDPDQFAWLLPFGVLGLPAVLAVFPAIGFAIARLLWSAGWGRVLAFAFGIGVSEWLRGHLFTGFPWNLFGMALGDNLVLGQVASVVGVYGLTVITAAIFAAPAVCIDRPASGQPRRSWRLLVSTPSLALLALAAIGLFGMHRLNVGPVGTQAGINLRIMQPNVPEDAQFNNANAERILSRYLALSDRATSPQMAGLSDVTHLIWPESAFPFILSRTPQALSRIAAALGNKTILITGAARMADTGQTAVRAAQQAYYNSIQVVGGDGTILGTADKVHLVPFGEYLPFESWLQKIGLRQFVTIPGGFVPGAKRALLHVPGLPPVAPLICYEAIFSGDVMPTDAAGARPGVLLNVTNDAWFGVTPGPYQHFAQARLRAIEEGLPMIRAANSGISAIVDPYGRVMGELPPGTDGVLDGKLPDPLRPTFFATHPLAGLLILFGLCFAGALIFRRSP